MINIFFTKRVIFILQFILLLLFISGIYYFYNKYQQIQQSQPIQNQQNQTAKLTDIIGKFMELPTDETPVIATITDIIKLKKQSFFAHGKNGDKVIIYKKNRKAILYDPTEKKIVEVGPVFITTASNSSTMVVSKQSLKINSGTPKLNSQ